MARSPYGVARIAVTILASTVMSVVVAPVVGEFFIGLAKEHHIYEASYEWPGKVMSWLLKYRSCRV
jgi:multidrug efflux pump subunit AcrB